MADLTRRRFLALGAGATAASVLTPSIARAAAIEGNHRHRSIRDVEHIVVLMQENRSFDHYFGSMRGVRGFGDPHPATLPSGKNVFHQPNGSGEVLPFHPDVKDPGLAFFEDLDHGWEGGHAALNRGLYDQWVPVKSPATMAYLTRADIPFHYALADAFTVCDAYHCSLLGPTDPNRYYLWTGSTGGSGQGGGPVIANDEIGYSWLTYPERLQQAGVSWKVYQDVGDGLDQSGYWGWTGDPYIGNYGDNSLLYFTQYQNAQPGDPLYERARIGTNAKGGDNLFSMLRADVVRGTLPSVSWIAAPEAYTEHPNWPANYGAWYVSQVLDALTSNPEVWSKTALFITYDENDGFFDHIVPAYAPMSPADGASTVDTALEIFHGTAGTPGGTNGTPGPYGLGQRVPMIVVSPWSRGGYVASEVFDHTSVIRFIEARFGVTEPGISPWRRAVCGDLTSAFDFASADDRVPGLPSTSQYAPPDRDRHPDVVPVPPADQQLPRQESGLRRARPVPYDLEVLTDVSAQSVSVRLINRGRAAAVFQVRDLGAPTMSVQMFTVGARRDFTATVAAPNGYDIEIHGPDGWYRRLAGSDAGVIEVSLHRAADGRRIDVVVTNDSGGAQDVAVTDGYTGRSSTRRVQRHASIHTPTTAACGWYDLTITSSHDSAFLRRFAGRVEGGDAMFSDPALGR